jgi:hypothetical protein
LADCSSGYMCIDTDSGEPVEACLEGPTCIRAVARQPEDVLVMELSPEAAKSKSLTLGVAAALMIIAGSPGELIVGGDLGTRWLYWAAAMVPFLYIVYELLVGSADATQLETEPKAMALFLRGQVVTVLSGLTYSVVYAFPMLGFSGSNATVAIQVGYCVSGILSMCGFGLIIYSITAAVFPSCSTEDELEPEVAELLEAPKLPETVQLSEPEAAKLPEVGGAELQPPELFFIGEPCFTDLEDMFSFDMKLIAVPRGSP